MAFPARPTNSKRPAHEHAPGLIDGMESSHSGRPGAAAINDEKDMLRMGKTQELRVCAHQVPPPPSHICHTG